MIIRKSLEHFDTFILMCLYSSCWLRLTWPLYDNILGMTFIESSPVLGIPRVIQRLHQS
jgi:hypothetical protein